MTSLREFLDERERELLEQIAELDRHRAPKEAELAEIRRAKAAIGAGSGGGWFFDRNAYFDMPELPPHLAATSGGVEPILPMGDNAARAPSPYEKMTMKELVVKVLSEHFPQGATTRQMLDFFRDGWGRHIERQNLSPQLSRLFQERVIGRRDDHVWFLLEPQPAAVFAIEGQMKIG